MAAKFDLNDDGVVVIVGSGAGGGTLGNELAQKGIKVVVLEAGPRVEMEEFVNNEWEAFSQISWLDKRTTSGSWRVAKDFAGLPAWIVKAVGGSTIHWAGASLRFQEHEFKTRTHYGDLAGANLLDWPITLKELEPYYAKAESKMGVTGTNGIPRLPGNNNYKVLAAGAKAMGYKEFHSGNMAINSQERDNRGSCQQIGFCFQGCKSGAKWSTLVAELPKGEDTGNLEVRSDAQVLKIEHDASGKVTGVLYGDKAGNVHRQKARIVAVAGNSIESPRLLLNSASSMFPDGLANSSGQVGRNYMRHTTGSVYATFENPVHMYRGTTMAGIVARRGPVRHLARLRRRVRAGNAVAGIALHGGLPQSGRLGPQLHLRPGRLRPYGRNVDRGRGHAAGNQPDHAACDGEGQVRHADPERPLRRPSQRRRHAQPCLPPGIDPVRGGGSHPHDPHAALSFDPQPRHQPDERERPRRRRQQAWAGP